MEPTQPQTPASPDLQPKAAAQKKTWLLPLTIGLVIVGLGVGALMLWQSMNTVAEEETPSAIVAITDAGFSPATIHVKKGQDVTWTNSSNVDHGVASEPANTGPNTDDVMGNGDTYSYVFDKPGTYTYRDQTNNSMTGVVVVE